MRIRQITIMFAVFTIWVYGCGGNTQAIQTGIAQTQQISALETAAAGNGGSQQNADTTAAISAEVTTVRDLNMRFGDSTQYDIMTVIPGGEKVQVIGINADGAWFQVSYNNGIGWISSQYVEGDVPADLPVVSAPQLASGGGRGGNDNGGGGGGNDDTSGGGNDNGGGGGDEAGEALTEEEETTADEPDLAEAPADSTFSGEFEVTNQDARTSFHDLISAPGGDLTDDIFVRLVDEARIPVSVEENILLKLNCSGTGAESVRMTINGKIFNVACNKTWSYHVSSDVLSLNIAIELPFSVQGLVYWQLIITVK